VFPHIYSHVKQQVMPGQFYVPSHPGVRKIVNIKCKITFLGEPIIVANVY